MSKYVAFLRGINVGGKRVPMKELKENFEKLGFQNIKTLLGTGNVIFEGSEDKLHLIQPSIEQKFGFEVDVLIFPHQKVLNIISSEPFKEIEVNPKTKLYITFFKELLPSTFQLPFSNEDNSIKILKKTDTAIYGLVDLNKSGTIEYMKILDKEFGKKVTTRNYNTIQKLMKM